MTSMIKFVTNEIILFQFSIHFFSATVTDLQRKIIHYPSANLQSLTKISPKNDPLIEERMCINREKNYILVPSRRVKCLNSVSVSVLWLPNPTE